MNIRELKNKIFESEDLYELMNFQFELSEYIGFLYKELKIAESEIEYSDIKSILTNANNLLEICIDKKNILKDTNLKLNHRFRMNAKKYMKREDYNFLIQKSHEPFSKKINN